MLLFANSQQSIPSFAFAAFAAIAGSKTDAGLNSPAHPVRSSPPPPTQPPAQPPANVGASIGRTLREKLARIVNEYLESHPEPIVGSIDNPFIFADNHGIRGVSILSVFFDHSDMHTFTCHFCDDHCTTIDDALQHQRVTRHFSEY
jgi:hypothetical protein